MQHLINKTVSTSPKHPTTFKNVKVFLLLFSKKEVGCRGEALTVLLKITHFEFHFLLSVSILIFLGRLVHRS